MGLIRFLLATAVLISHAGPICGFKLMDSVIAVQCFFIVSGFYMSLILSEKYDGIKNYKLFITNRLLRIYPLYFAILLLTFGCMALLYYFGHQVAFFNTFEQTDSIGKIYAVVMNLSLVGQESALFLGTNENGTLQFMSDFTQSPLPVHNLLIVPPSWSLSLEIMFYLIAPFILNRKLILVLGLIITSLGLRFYVYHLGYQNDPWLYRFFPFELAFFLSGNLAYRWYKKIQHKPVNKEIWIVFGIIALMFAFHYLPGSYDLKKHLFYILFLIALPFVFHATKNIKTDRWIGELSYPIYLSHVLIFVIAIPIVHFMLPNPEWNGILTLLMSILFSIAIQYVLLNPIEKFRASRASQMNQTKKP